MANSQARDGRQSLSFILVPDKETPVSGISGSLKIGDIVVITGKAASESVFGDVAVNKFYIVNKALALKEGDSCFKCTPHFLGQATGKTVSASKNITDMTIDYDESTNNVTDGIVTKTGSISGALITEDIESEGGVNYVKNRFDDIIQIDADGTSQVKEADTTGKDILMIIWNGRNAKAGDLLEIEIMPVLFSDLSTGGEYGSAQSFDVDFSTCYTDDNNYTGARYQVANAEGLLPSIVRPAA